MELIELAVATVQARNPDAVFVCRKCGNTNTDVVDVYFVCPSDSPDSPRMRTSWSCSKCQWFDRDPFTRIGAAVQFTSTHMETKLRRIPKCLT